MKAVEQVVIRFSIPLIVLLFGGNIWFVKRMIDEQDLTKQIVWQLRQDVAVMQATGQSCKCNFKNKTGG